MEVQTIVTTIEHTHIRRWLGGSAVSRNFEIPFFGVWVGCLVGFCSFFF